MSFASSIDTQPKTNIQPIPQKGLAEIQFIGSVEAIFSNIKNDSSYSKTVGLVWNELVYNDAQNHPWDIVNRPAYSKVKAVIDTYLNLLQNNSSYPEYIADSSRYQNGQTTNQMNSLLNIIAQQSGAGIDFTTMVMNQLYWDTVQGRSYSPAIAFPRTNKNFGQITSTPTDYANKSIIGQGLDAAGNLVDAAGTIIKTAAELAAGAASGTVSIIKYLPYIIGGTALAVIVWKGSDILKIVRHKK